MTTKNSPISRSPEGGIFATVIFSWVTPILQEGARRPLTEDDIGLAPEQNSSLFTYKRLSHCWKEELANSNCPSLIRAFSKAFRLQLLLSGFCFSFFLLITFIQPLLVSKLLQYADGGHVEIFGIHSYGGLIVALTLGMASCGAAVAFNNGFYYMQQFGLMTRSAMIAIIFEKSLSISNATRQSHSTGEIMTLMSVDVERLWLASLLCNWLVMGPLMCVVTIVLLYLETGYASFVVAAALFLWGYLQEVVSRMIGSNRQLFVKFTADRTKVMNEILQGIRVVKLYAWEEPCAKRICDIREKEVNQLASYLVLKLSNTVVQFIGPVLIAYILFMTFSGLGNTFDTPKAYTMLSILNIARVPIMLFPIARTSMQEALSSAERIRRYLLETELHLERMVEGEGAVVAAPLPTAVADVSSAPTDEIKVKEIELVEAARAPARAVISVPADAAASGAGGERIALVEITEGCFAWGSSSPTEKAAAEAAPASAAFSRGTADAPADTLQERCALTGVNLRIYAGERVAIVGSVGAGKTSLVMALLGQMTTVSGKHSLRARKAAYASQDHWIQNMTVQDNILFDSPMDRLKYETVLKAAQLSKDMTTLPHGDATEIGERGINLSGGQKARVNMARALYCPDACLHIFDDPFAAVDVHVGKALFREVFLGVLDKKTVVLTLSSNYQFLPHFDKIIVIDAKCGVSVCESYAELRVRFPMYILDDPEEDTVPPVASPEPVDSSTTSTVTSSVAVDTTSKPDVADSVPSASINAGTMTKENQEIGAVTASVYTRYFAASLKNSNFSAHGVIAMILVLFLIGQLFRVFCDLFVGEWATNNPPHSTTYYYTVFTLLAVGVVVFVIARSVYFLMQCLAASKALHNDLLVKVLGASVNRYFDVTPIGRILNRFSKDLDHIDSMLPDFFLHMLQNGFHVLAVVGVCVASTPFFVIVAVPLALLYYFIQEQFRRSSRELRRMESVARSPIYTLFGELLIGLSTVRAYGRQQLFFEKLHRVTDNNNKFFYTFWICSRWLALRLDLLGAAAVFCVSLIAVLMVHFDMPIDGNLLGVAIVFALQLAVLLQWTVRTVIETENNMTSVERLLAFNEIESEQTHTGGDGVPALQEVPAAWPSKGEIVLKGISMRYREGLPLVLKDVCCSIPGGYKLGVCGRTGSGKSSLMLALFRIVEPQATPGAEISIDGINILNISLFSLRSRLTIIPQDPVMFSGTLRFNLDPFGQYSDAEIWDALEKVELKADVLSKFTNKLDYEISERGENVSVGQRQLLCIARALLRKSKVIIMDEATASVDSLTDTKIQNTIRRSFKDCTVLTIAHRLETIADYDMIMVMDQGSVAECGLPHDLLQLQNGYFAGLVNELGPEAKASFVNIAAKRADNPTASGSSRC